MVRWLSHWFGSRWRRWLTIGVVLALLMLRSWWNGRFVPVETAQARRGALTLPILTSGEVDGDASDLSFDIGGTVAELYVDEGDAVVEGQPLARLTVGIEMGRTAGAIDIITAPYDGYVVKIDRRVGSTIQAGLPVLRVVRRGAVWVTAYLDAEDAAHVKPGDRFTCRAGGYLARPWDLTVESVGREALPRDELPGSANQVRVKLRPVAGFALPVGAEVDVDGEVVIAADQLLIPAAALVRRAGKSYVWRVDGMRVTKVEVRTGPNNFRDLAIEAGLQPGDTVVVYGKEGLKPGSLVRAKPVEEQEE